MTTQLLHPKVDPIIQARKILTVWYYKKYPSDDCFVPHLEHWLGAFDDAESKPEGYYYYMLDGSMHYEEPGKPQYVLFKFDRDTGQPDSPEDYKIFNDIVGI